MKDVKTEKPAATAVAAAGAGDYGRRQKSFNFYDGYLRQFEKDSTIKINQQVLQ